MQVLEAVMLAPPDSADDHYAVPLDAMLLAQADPGLADAVVRHPKVTLDVLESALYSAQVRRGAKGHAWARMRRM